MPSLEERLYEHLTADVELAGHLTAFHGQPAVFELLAPPDTAPGWAGRQTPRLEYKIERQHDPERGVAGRITVAIIDRGEAMERTAAAAAVIRRLMDWWTAQTNDGTVTLSWSDDQLFDQDPDYRGLETTFELIAWPTGLTYSPDPVGALRQWVLAYWPQLQVNPVVWVPTDQAPALYWRMATVQTAEVTNWGAWMEARLRAHIVAPGVETRQEWTRRIVEGLAMQREVTLADGSPLRCISVSADSGSDPLRHGQVSLTARFGVLKGGLSVPAIKKAVYSGAIHGEET